MRKQYGLSLVELMISITLGLVLMAGVVQMFISSKKVFSTQQGMARIQETGRLAAEFLSRDIRMAAFYGCYRPSNNGTHLKNQELVVGGLHGNFEEGIRGYDTPALAGGKTVLGTTLTLLPAANTQNVVVIRSAPVNDPGFRISGAHTATSAFVYTQLTALDNGCANGICAPSGSRPGSVAVVNDCVKAQIFQVTGLALSANQLTITHSNPQWDLAPSTRFDSGDILPVNTTVYFLAERPNSSGVGKGIPSLWQKTNTDAAVELLEGVEHMRITYATKTNTTYRLSSLLTADDWPSVTSVRLDFVVRSIENNAVAEKQPYKISDSDPASSKITPSDGDLYLRQAFSVTVAIRSRL